MSRKKGKKENPRVKTSREPHSNLRDGTGSLCQKTIIAKCRQRPDVMASLRLMIAHQTETSHHFNFKSKQGIAKIKVYCGNSLWEESICLSNTWPRVTKIRLSTS